MYRSNRQKRYIILLTAIAGLIFVAFQIVFNAVMEQEITIQKFLDKQASIVGSALEAQFAGFQNDLILNSEIRTFDTILQNDGSEKRSIAGVRKLYSKYQDMIAKMEIYDSQHVRTIVRQGENYFQVSDVDSRTSKLEKDPKGIIISVDQDHFDYVYPVYDLGGELFQNIKVRIDTRSMFRAVIKDSYIGQKSLFWMIHPELGPSNTSSYLFGEEIKTIEGDGVEEIVQDIRDGFAGEVEHEISTADTDTDVISAYYPVKLYTYDFGVVLSIEEQEVTGQIQKTIMYVSIVFVLIVAVMLFLFMSMMRNLKFSFGQLEDYSKNLEQKVKDRTQQLEIQNQEIETKNTDLENTLNQLQMTQSQLIQSEKMASLGQLIAGIAHEINTPIGAIKASSGNIEQAFLHAIKALPMLHEQLSRNELDLFLRLLEKSVSNKQNVTTREERAFKKTNTAALIELGLSEDVAATCANQLVKIGVYDQLEDYLTLFHKEQAEQLFDLIYYLGRLQKNIDLIQMSVERTSKIVFALKSYAHYQNTDEMVGANLADTLETVLSLYQNQFKQGITLQKQYDSIPEIKCFPDELNQVWTNIIHNAIQAMKGTGELTISLSQSSGHVIVGIRDNGPGIPSEVLPKIFQPFFTTKPQGEGSGLGLDICLKIIEKHHGRIEVESVPGNTFFQVVLPIGGE